MTESTYHKIIEDIRGIILKKAEENDWLWFYQLHQKEVLKCAKKLLKLYRADKRIVIIACWLHDVSRYSVKNKLQLKASDKIHHIESAKFAKDFLGKYDLSKQEISNIYNCVIRHRNASPYKARSKEEKIVSTADTISHFSSVFYMTHFKFHPDNSIDDLVRLQHKKLGRDWADLSMLPKAKSLVKKEYQMLRRLHKNYFRNEQLNK